MKYVYIDWNVFNRIEKRHDDTYLQIEEFIKNEKIITPYSNAHINDLIRGYEKNSSYINGHLQTLERLTKNLCITQYWGEKNSRWHYRNVFEFFESALEDNATSAKSFKDLFKNFGDDMPEVSVLWEIQLSNLRAQKLPSGFKDLFKENPAFALMFPKAKMEMTALSFCEDLYEFATNSKKDYSIYKTLRNYINQSRLKFKNNPEVFRNIDKSMGDKPNYLTFDETLEAYEPKTKVTDNPIYNKVTSTYHKIDLKGFKSDEKFSNLIDDSLHVFYGAHCEAFVSIDDKCLYKASKTYEELKIKTLVIEPENLVEMLSE